MAVRTVMNESYIKPETSKVQSRASYTEGAIGQTDRGTAIVNSNTNMGQNSFLKLLVAQLSNLDPSQDQDSTAYVTQMAQFASIEQLNNLNTTMGDFANQQKVGQVAILNEVDAEGNHKWGLINQIYKVGTTTYASVLDPITGEVNAYDIKNIIGTSDSGYSSSNFETALNSKYLAAAKLAENKSNAVLTVKVKVDKLDEHGEVMKDSNGDPIKEEKLTGFKGTIEGAYIDKQNNVVKVTVSTVDEKGEKTTKEYDYDDIVIAGNLSDETMDEMIKKIETTGNATGKTEKSVNTNNQSYYSYDASLSAEVIAAKKAEEEAAKKAAEEAAKKAAEENADKGVEQVKENAAKQAREIQDPAVAREMDILNKIAGI